jgi:hypothetical protein
MTNAVITAQQGSTQSDAGFKNRVINGDMRIDQRNVGAAVTTILQSQRFSVDRWSHYGDVSARLTLQQSTSAPSGFTNSLLATVIATDATGPQQFIQQIIEGYNIADFGWGTPAATTVSLSFWVRSNLSGQFGGSLQNYNTSRSYPFAYTITAANTWEYKTVTIAPDTVGPWQTANNHGVRLLFELGAGYQKTTAGAWVSSNTTSSLGSTNLCATLGATWQVTGVQLETGSAATGFDYRFYGTELAMCQRYFEKSFNDVTAPTNGPNTTSFSTEDGLVTLIANNGAFGGGLITFKVTKRTTPGMTAFGNSNGHWGYGTGNIANAAALTWSGSTFGPSRIGAQQVSMTQQVVNGSYITIVGHWTASAEM